MPMVTRLIRVVTYRKELLPTISYGPSMGCSYEVTWQTKYIISPPAEDPWTPN